MEYEFRPITTWPGKQTNGARRSNFSAGWTDTMRLLERELKCLGARRIVIQAYVGEGDIRNDGMLRANASPSRPGIILSFDSKHGPLSYPCDTYSKWQCNLRAIALALDALRTVDRYGVTRRGEQYTGWKALPAPSAGPADDIRDADGARQFIRNVLGATTINGDIESFVRMAELKTHPDKGGNADDFKRVQKCRELLTKGGT